MRGKSSGLTPSVVYSTISIAIVLFLLAAYGLLFLHATNIGNLIKEKINIIVELRDDTPSERVATLMRNIELQEGVREGSLAFVPRKEALITMQKFLANIDREDDVSPFRDIITFNMAAEYYDEEMIEKIRQMLVSETEVIDVFSENETIEMVKGNVKKMSLITLVIGAVFVFLSLAIIYNTMKLKLHADRLEIKTMQLVGATRIFIARPYIREAIELGFRSFLIVSTFIVALLTSLYFNVEGFDRIINWWYALSVLLGILVFGVVMTVGVTRYVVQGYLNAETVSLV